MSVGTISGKSLHGYVGNNLVRGMANWTFTVAVEPKLDGKTGEDAGYAHPDSGGKAGTGELTIVNRIGTATHFAIDQEDEEYIEDLYLYETEDETAAAAHIPNALITRVQRNPDVNTRLEYKVSFETVGPFTTARTVA